MERLKILSHVQTASWDLHLPGKAQFCGIEGWKLIIDERLVSLVIGRKGHSYVHMAGTDRSREIVCAMKRSFFRDLTSSLREFNSFIVE